MNVLTCIYYVHLYIHTDDIETLKNIHVPALLI